MCARRHVSLCTSLSCEEPCVVLTPASTDDSSVQCELVEDATGLEVPQDSVAAFEALTSVAPAYDEDEDDEDKLVAAGGRNAPAAMDREELHLVAEAHGELRFDLVRFDAQDAQKAALPILLLLKDLFAEHLPKMVGPYFTEMLFNPRHIAIACILRGELVAGLLYRPHAHVDAPPAVDECTQGATCPAGSAAFAELIFFAVDSKRQVGGLGSRLMSRLKAELLRQGISRIVTYADDNAISFFHSQGFTHKLSRSNEAYSQMGQYVQATMMEAIQYREIPYAQSEACARAIGPSGY